MLEAIIFDMDGLLIDSEAVWYQVRREWMASQGVEWTDADQRAVMGVDTKTWVGHMAGKMDSAISSQEIEQAVLDGMAAAYARDIPFMPGAVEAVQLAADHFPTGLASGSHRALIDIVLDHPSLRGRFRVVQSADEVGAGKPAPDVYLEAARRLGANPKHSACLEDSANGILSGARAGMKVIAVPSRYFMPEDHVMAQASKVLSSLESFSLELLAQLDGC